MDFTTIVGLLLALATLIGGYLLEGGNLNGLFFPTAVLIMFGGTIAVTIASFTGSQLKNVFRGLHTALFVYRLNRNELIEEFIGLATTARRDGILRLENESEQHPEPFIRNGLMLIVDGTDPQLTKQMLELEIEGVYRDGEQQSRLFDTAGGFAPTLGIIGTVLGLINLLGNLQEPASLAKSVSIAFTATLYGVASANLIYLPIANKIRARTEERIADLEMMMTGLLSIQAGDHPNLVRRKLESFLGTSSRGPARETGDET